MVMQSLMTVVIPILIQEAKPGHRPPESLIEVTEKCIGYIIQNTVHPFNLMVVDNGSSKEAAEHFRCLKAPNYTYVRHNSRERGMVEVINETYQRIQTPLIAYVHNDFYILEEAWDNRVHEIYRNDPKLGIIGFGGGFGMDGRGFRYGFASNMVYANKHGVHRWEGWMPAFVLDGMIMIMTKKMLNAVHGCGGAYKIHHFYDLHMSAASVFHGFHNYVLFVRCRHLSGRTRVSPNLKSMEVYKHNKIVFEKRWARRLPAYVTKDFKIKAGFPPARTHEPHFFPRKSPQAWRATR